ncbi:MAG TPA: tetratricopeptide repeat protein [Elusimicrobiales bacterium]|nr:tetratricopeptide repeat protein [Elusimicrobiales bacterium]
MAAPEENLPVGRGPLALLLTAIFFVSPLLFFTDLTRNPYYFQITLLNISLLAAAALFVAASLKRGAWLLPRTPLNLPLAALLAVYAASFAYSLAGHAAFFRPAMLSEGLRAGLFSLVNCALVFFLAYSIPFASGRDAEVPVGKWLSFILVWGGLWFLFPWLKAPSAGGGALQKMLDPYGSLLWAGGIAAVYFLIKRCRQEDILHLALSVGAIASLYGVCEYFHVEVIWAKLINPYGNRSVSTFGNPNFVSSFVVMLLPLAAWRLIRAETAVKRFYYGLVFLSYEGMLMASLTRSSWIGAAVGLGFLGACVYRRGILSGEGGRFRLLFFSGALLLLFAWPSSSLKLFSSGLVDRVSEASKNLNSPSSFSLATKSNKTYASFHQRLLIWTSAWQMGLENPLLGKGWGQFELFYPFYQGRLLFNFPEVRGLRTHANNAHNEMLEQWSQAGLLGLGVYLWLLATLFCGFFRFLRAAPDAGCEAAPLAAGLAGMLADNMLNVSIHFAVPALAFWWLAGALVLKTTGAGAPAFAAWRRPRAAMAAAWLLLAACLGGAWFWQRQFTRELRYFAGFKAMRANNFAGAAAALKSAWEAHPREVNSNYEMGNAYVRSGDPDKGAWGYLEALKSNAGYDEIYFNLAIILKRLGRTQEALKNLQVSSFINPLNQTTWQAMAEIYLSLPDREKYAGAAAADFEEAVKAFPDDGNMWNTLGYFYTLKKDFRAARSAYGRGVKAAPDNKMLVENLVGVSRRLQLPDDPDLAWLGRYLALDQALNAARTDPAAIKAAEALVALDPENLKARTLRAKFYFKAGRLADARRELASVLADNDADNSVRYGLASVYEKEGNFALARAEWSRFLQYEPGNSAVAARLQALP